MKLIKVFNGCPFFGKVYVVIFFKSPITGQYVQSKTRLYMGCAVCGKSGDRGLYNTVVHATQAHGIFHISHATCHSLRT